MIEIPRPVLRRLRAVFRRLTRVSLSIGNPAVSMQTGPDGLRVRLHQAGVQAEWHQPGSFANGSLVMPLDLLADCEGSKGSVVFDAPSPKIVRARWEDARVPQSVEYDQPDPNKLPPFPEPARNLSANEPRLWTALAHASRSTARDAIHYATDHVQLRGQAGQIVATNSRQLLLQSGFTFPFKDDFLIPSVPVFGCKELAVEQSVAVGKEGETLTLRVGEWTFFLPIHTDGRFPKTEQVIPATSRVRSRLRLSPDDAAFLATSLPRLPGDDEGNSPVTLDLNGQAIIRAKASGQELPTELVLARSQASGTAVRFAINRELLERALVLGLHEFEIVDGETPVLAQDAKCQFLFMPLGVKEAIPASNDAVRIVSAEADQPSPTSPVPRRKRPMKRSPAPNSPPTNGNGRHPTNADGAKQAVSGGMAGLIAEAEALRALLRDGYARASRLLVALKRQRQQSKLLNTTVTALRQLQNIDG